MFAFACSRQIIYLKCSKYDWQRMCDFEKLFSNVSSHFTAMLVYSVNWVIAVPLHSTIKVFISSDCAPKHSNACGETVMITLRSLSYKMLSNLVWKAKSGIKWAGIVTDNRTKSGKETEETSAYLQTLLRSFRKAACCEKTALRVIASRWVFLDHGNGSKFINLNMVQFLYI